MLKIAAFHPSRIHAEGPFSLLSALLSQVLLLAFNYDKAHVMLQRYHDAP